MNLEPGITQTAPILCASGDALAFRDASFDAVCEFVLPHHVPNPNDVVKEMLRVARKSGVPVRQAALAKGRCRRA
jgi:ubiquinone/menaquinone biosynthesis C-methylase UbiE